MSRHEMENITLILFDIVVYIFFGIRIEKQKFISRTFYYK